MEETETKEMDKNQTPASGQIVAPKVNIIAPSTIMSPSPGTSYPRSKSVSNSNRASMPAIKGKSISSRSEAGLQPLDEIFSGPKKKSILKNTTLKINDALDDLNENDNISRIPSTRAPPNFLGITDPKGSINSRSRRTTITRTPMSINDDDDENGSNFENIRAASSGYGGLDFAFTDDEIERLARRFMVLDQDSSGTLDIAEFMAIPELQQNNLAERIIRLFDKDKNGVVDFKEFIDGISVFSTKSDQEAKMKFAFRVYDIDNDGYISNADLFQTLTMMVGETIKDVHLQEIVNRTILSADTDEDGKISFQEFCEFVGTRSVVTNSYSRLHIEV